MSRLRSEISTVSIRYLDVCSPIFLFSWLGRFHLMDQSISIIFLEALSYVG